MGTFFLVGLIPIPAIAEEAGLVVEMTVEKKTPPGEKTTETEATEAQTEEVKLVVSPGDILVYHLVCINKTEESATEVIITDPIPEGTEHIINSATGDSTKITFSIDGGNIYQSPPVTYQIRKLDGTIQVKLATPDMYTHIRWLFTGDIMPGESRRASFEVRVK